jgi:hypothetical protein
MLAYIVSLKNHRNPSGLYDNNKVTTIYILTMTHNDPLCVTYDNSSVVLSYMSAVLSYHCSYLCMYDNIQYRCVFVNGVD